MSVEEENSTNNTNSATHSSERLVGSSAALIVHRLLFAAALDLSAKAFAQPVGVEDNWEDLGDGVVEISPQNTLRVVRAPAPAPQSTSAEVSDGDEEGGGGKKKKKKKKKSGGNTTGADILDVELLNSGRQSPGSAEVLIEDHISDEIPLVGKDCCIVWNSPTHDMSFCIMFTSECGYAAVWSAVHLLQGKNEIPGLEWDYLSSFRSMEEDGSGGEEEEGDGDDVGEPSEKEEQAATKPKRPSPPSVASEREKPSARLHQHSGGGGGGGDDGDELTGSMKPSQSEEPEEIVGAGKENSAPSSSNSSNSRSKTMNNSEKSEVAQLINALPALAAEEKDETSSSKSKRKKKRGIPASSPSSVSPSASGSFSSAASSATSSPSAKIAEAFSEAVRHVSSMSFIHRHCVAQSYIDGRCAVTTSWGLKNSSVAQILFSLFHPGLIFHCVDDDEVFEKLLSVVSAEAANTEVEDSEAAAAAGGGGEDNNNNNNNKKSKKASLLPSSNNTNILSKWKMPKYLPESEHGLDIAKALNRSMRLSLLRHEMIVPGTEEGVLTFLETLQQQELHSVLAAVTDNGEFINDIVGTICSPSCIADVCSNSVSAGKVEAALRCLSDILQNAVTLLPREMMMPMIARIDDCGLADAVEKLAAKILEQTVLSNNSSSSSSSNSSKKKESSNTAQSSSCSSSSCYSASQATPETVRVMSAIAYLFEASAVCLNTRAEEGILGGFWRRPLMSSSFSTTPTESKSKNENNNNNKNKPASVNAVLKLLALWARIVPITNTSAADSITSATSLSGSFRAAKSQSALAAASATSKKAEKNKNELQEQSKKKYTSGLHRGGTFFLYHLCGLHDDEGHTVDRSSDFPVVDLRDAFQLHIATCVIPLMLHNNCYSLLVPSSSSETKSSSKQQGLPSFSNPPSSSLQNSNNMKTLKPIITSSELAFFESFLNWCNLECLKKLLQAMIGEQSALPSLLASIPSLNSNSTSSDKQKEEKEKKNRKAKKRNSLSNSIESSSKEQEDEESEDNEEDDQVSTSIKLLSSSKRLDTKMDQDQEKESSVSSSTTILRQQLPSHALCARVRCIRSILQAFVKVELLANAEAENIILEGGPQENLDLMLEGNKTPSYGGIQNSRQNSTSSSGPLANVNNNNNMAAAAQRQRDLQVFAQPLMFQLTFENDIMLPLLTFFQTQCSGSGCVRRRGGSLFVGAMNSLLSNILNGGSILLSLRKFLRLRHGLKLPEEMRKSIEQEEEKSMRDELVAFMQMISSASSSSTSSSGKGDAASAAAVSAFRLNNNLSELSFVSNSGLLSGSVGGGAGSSSGGTGARTKARSTSPGNSPIPAGMFATTGSPGSGGGGGVVDTSISPSRRTQLVVDAEIPPPRSPEQIPLKRRSPSPIEGHLKPSEAAASSAHSQQQRANNNNNNNNNNSTSSSSSSRTGNLAPLHPTGGDSIWSSSSSSSTSSSSSNNRNNNNAASSSSSLIAADLNNNSSSNNNNNSNSNSSSTTTALTGVQIGGSNQRVQPPRKPRNSNEAPRAGSTGSAAGTTANNNNNAGSGGRPNSRGGIGTNSNNNNNAASSSSSSSNPSSPTGGRPKSGGGLRTRSPVSGLSGNSALTGRF